MIPANTPVSKFSLAWIITLPSPLLSINCRLIHLLYSYNCDSAFFFTTYNRRLWYSERGDRCALANNFPRNCSQPFNYPTKRIRFFPSVSRCFEIRTPFKVNARFLHPTFENFKNYISIMKNLAWILFRFEALNGSWLTLKKFLPADYVIRIWISVNPGGVIGRCQKVEPTAESTVVHDPSSYATYSY